MDQNLKTILKKLMIAIIASLILSVSISSYSYIPVAKQQPGTIYWSFLGLIIIFLIYSAPVYILGGIPFSILIDIILSKLKKVGSIVRYLISVLLYGLAGVLSTLVLLFIVSNGKSINEGIYLYYIGIVAAELYLHLSILINQISRRR
jgi:hypothetical protein